MKRYIFTPVVCLVWSKSVQLSVFPFCLVSHRQNVKWTRIYQQKATWEPLPVDWSQIKRFVFAGRESTVCFLAGYFTLFKMDQYILHLCIIAEVIWTIYQTQIIEQKWNLWKHFKDHEQCVASRRCREDMLPLVGCCEGDRSSYGASTTIIFIHIYIIMLIAHNAQWGNQWRLV